MVAADFVCLHLPALQRFELTDRRLLSGWVGGRTGSLELCMAVGVGLGGRGRLG